MIDLVTPGREGGVGPEGASKPFIRQRQARNEGQG